MSESEPRKAARPIEDAADALARMAEGEVIEDEPIDLLAEDQSRSEPPAATDPEGKPATP